MSLNPSNYKSRLDYTYVLYQPERIYRTQTITSSQISMSNSGFDIVIPVRIDMSKTEYIKSYTYAKSTKQNNQDVKDDEIIKIRK